SVRAAASLLGPLPFPFPVLPAPRWRPVRRPQRDRRDEVFAAARRPDAVELVRYDGGLEVPGQQPEAAEDRPDRRPPPARPSPPGAGGEEGTPRQEDPPPSIRPRQRRRPPRDHRLLFQRLRRRRRPLRAVADLGAGRVDETLGGVFPRRLEDGVA